ncbi:hypothetical protein OROHE_013019 [Orobanche hederae]
MDSSGIENTGVGDYEVIELVGEGSFGKVYKERRKSSGETVAIKYISIGGKDEDYRLNLRKETDFLKGLKHGNIIGILDSFEIEKEFCVVTEFAQDDLSKFLKDGKGLPEKQVQAIAIQLIGALQYLRSKDIIHRYMKPQNIRTAGSIVKVCDFGFAQARQSIKGKTLYMAPELVQEQPYNRTADLWSLGVILYELFVGQPPLRTNSVGALITEDLVEYLDNMSVSRSFKSFLQGLLIKDSQQRLRWSDLLKHLFVKDASAEMDMKLCAHTSSLRGFGGAVRQDENVQKPTCFTGASLEIGGYRC